MSLKVALPPHQHAFKPIHPFSLPSPASKAAAYQRTMVDVCHGPPLGRHSDFRHGFKTPPQLTTRCSRESRSSDLSRTSIETSFDTTKSGLRTIHQSKIDISATEDYTIHSQDGKGWCRIGRGGETSSSRIPSLSRRLSCNASGLPGYRPLPRLHRENAFKITSNDAQDEFLYRAGLSCEDNSLSDDPDSCTTQFPDFVGADDGFQ